MRAELTLPSITSEEAPPERKAPIRVKFEIPYFTVSGIQVVYWSPESLFLSLTRAHTRIPPSRQTHSYYVSASMAVI